MLTIESLPFGQLQNNTTCSNIICYNLAQAAPALSQLAAVLASFVFGAIILALGNPPKNKTVKDISLPLLSSFTAFVSLLISCYLFGDIAGQETIVSLFISSLAPSSVFSLAALLLMLSIAWYFKSYEVEPLVISGAYWLTQGVILMIVAYLIFTFSDTYIIATNEVWSTPLFHNSVYNSIIISMLGLIVLYFLPCGIALFIRRRWKGQRKDNSISSSLFARASLLALLISVILTIVFTIADAIYLEFPDQNPGPQFASIIWIILLITVILLLFFFVPYQVGLPSNELKIRTKQMSDQEQSRLSMVTQPQVQSNVILYQELSNSHQIYKRTFQNVLLLMTSGIAVIALVVSIIMKLSLNRRNNSKIL